MKRPRIDLEHPVRSLRDAAGFDSQGAAAEALGMTPASLSQTEGRGSRIKFKTFFEIAEKLGYEIEIHARKKDDT